MIIIPTLLALAATIAAVVMVVLTIANIIDWFRSRNAITEADKNRLKLTFQERLQNGNFGTVQAIYDEDSETVVAIRKVESESVDEQLREAHSEQDLISWKIA